ncbi:MAG: hypothetical protein K9L60_06640 [Methylovulum sp.]|nr:hypothetical protein [Methylovulum sp.]MCF7998951.1 hypothetical protein [Methylovulum sp.]
MFLASRLVIIVLLALLQLIAPLVHAHANNRFVTEITHEQAKLHIPGLELYLKPRLEMSADVLWQTCRVALNTPTEGIVIGVDTGIKQKQQLDLCDSDNDCGILIIALVFLIPFVAKKISLPDFLQPKLPNSFIPSAYARAPPSLFIV